MFFKKKIAENLEDKLTDIISNYREKMDYDNNARIARDKSYTAEKHMLGGLAVAATGAAGGVGGLAASLHMGVGALALAGTSLTVGGAILVAGVGVVGVAGLAYMGISKIVKSYHESVANSNSSYGGYIKEEFSVKKDFMKKIENALGGYSSELYNKAFEKGVIRELESGINLDENAKKLLDLRKELNNSVSDSVESKQKLKI
jgi:hypothetical protein